MFTSDADSTAEPAVPQQSSWEYRGLLGALIDLMSSQGSTQCIAGRSGVALSTAALGDDRPRLGIYDHLDVDGQSQPINAAALIHEQMPEADAFIAALSGQPDRFFIKQPPLNGTVYIWQAEVNWHTTTLSVRRAVSWQVTGSQHAAGATT